MYFDHSQDKNEDSVTIGGYLPIQKVYGYDPVPGQLQGSEKDFVLGAQANVWTEYIKSPSKLEYMVFPRMSALSEVLWTPKEVRSWEGFEPRLKHEFRRYDWWNVHYSKAFFSPENN